MGTQDALGSKLSLGLALAVSAVLTACGGGGGGDSTPATPVATNGSGSTTTSTAGNTTAATNTTPSSTSATSTPSTTTPAVTTPSNNAQTTPSSNLAMYEQLRTQCPVVGTYTSEEGFYACAAGTYVGKNLRDGSTVCTVRLTREGDVTYTMGDTVHAFKLEQRFFYMKSNPQVEEYPHIWGMKTSGYGATDANGKMHGFELGVEPMAVADKLPYIDIKYTYGGGYVSEVETTCRVSF